MHFANNSKKITDRKIAKVSIEQQPKLENKNVDEWNTQSNERLEREDGKNNALNGCDNRNFIPDAWTCSKKIEIDENM